MNFDELKNLIKGEVTTSAKELARTSRDASIFVVQPQAVVYPKKVDDLKNLVRWVSTHKPEFPDLSLTARSAGTDMSGGPLNESIVLDFTKHFNHIEGIGDGYAVTEPGVYYRDFEKETLTKGWLLPSYPASRDLCTVGGMVANNSGGEKSLVYGKTENYVQELDVILADGNEYHLRALTRPELEAKKSQQDFEGQFYRDMYDLLENNYDAIKAAKPNVSKNSAGYYLWNVWDRNTFDLTRLFTGSQGTLGLISKIRFKLVQPKKYSKLLVMFLRDLAPLGDVVNEVMKYKPESFETYDDQTLRLAIKFMPSLAKKMRGGLLGMFFKFLPEIKMVLTGGLPKLVLLAEFTGDDDQDVERRLAEAKSDIESRFKLQTTVTHNAGESEKYWQIRRESFNLLRKHVGEKHTAPFIDDIIVHVEQLPKFLPQLNELVGQYKGLTYTIAGHAGDANFHVIPLMDFHSEENRKAIPELSDKVYDLVISLHGSITAEHNDGLIRTPYLEKMYGSQIIELFRKTKQIFDPQNIFNPGKKVRSTGSGQVPGDLQYAISHIVKE